MKKYKKQKSKKGKLLQIRLSDKEYEHVKEFINKFEVTHREWLLATVERLNGANLLVNGVFYQDWKHHSYENSDKWDKKIDENSVCEECGNKHGGTIGTQLERHHYLGYIGDNGLKVQILCRPCHGKKPKSLDKKDCGICMNTRIFEGRSCVCTGSVTSVGLQEE